MSDAPFVSVQVSRIPCNYGSAYVPVIETFSGNIMPNPKWVADDCICLTTDDPDFNFRIIKKNRILSSNVYIQPSTVDNSKRTFTVDGSKGNTYTVTKDGATWSCACVGFGFRRDCKHIQSAKNQS